MLYHLKMLSFNGFEVYVNVFQEIVIVKVLSDLHQTICDYQGYEYMAHSFPKIYTTRIVHGEIPNYFLIRKYDESTTKTRELERFEELHGVPQEHLAILMKFCGDSLWHLIQKSSRSKSYAITPEQLLSVCYQLTLAMAVAEGAYEFEHRDLHVCNVLVKKTKKEHVVFKVQSITYRVKSFGVKACIIDAGFARISVGGKVFFTDLSNRLKTTAESATTDPQELAYQQMYRLIFDKWRDWYPQTNIVWLKYFYNEVLTTDAFNTSCDPAIKRDLLDLIEAVDNYKSLVEFAHKTFQCKTDKPTEESESIVSNSDVSFEKNKPKTL